MKIELGVTGATSYTKRFESPAQKIGFVATAVAIADLTSAFVTVQLFGRDGSPKIVTPRTPLVDLMEIAASNEGMVLVENSAGKYKYYGTVELSNSGAIDIQGGYLQIQLDNTVSTTIFDLYAIDGDFLVQEHISYMPIYCNALQYKEINLEGVYAIAVPAATLTELQISKYGRTQIMYQDEVKMLSLETNEISFAWGFDIATKQNFKEIEVGGKNWYVIGVRGAVNGRVMLGVAGPIYIMSNEQL